jgi:hypothetical protein
VVITARPTAAESASLKACHSSCTTRVVQVTDAGYGSRYTSGPHKGQCNTSPNAPELAKGAVQSFQLSADLSR